MPKKSKTDNLRKICGCAKWKTCAHPWYLDFQVRGERCQRSLDKIVGRHPVDFVDAKDEAHRAIKALREGRDPSGLVPDDQPTLAQLLDAFAREKPRSDRWQIGKVCATALRSPSGMRPFGEWRVGTITADVLKDFQRQRPLVAGNRDLALLRTAFNYAVVNHLVPRSPFRVGDVTVVKLQREEPRSRRLQPGEAERLLAHARTLAPIITAALETGCRKDELLSLQWHQVRFTPRAEIFLPAQKTKTKKDRRVPISSVLQRVLDARRRDPAGDPLPPDAFVFGDEIGRRRGDIDRAWEIAVLKSRGHAPVWVRSTTASRSAKLAPESRRQLKDAGLHFHDLRREAGSRWMDAGVPLATIQRWLGHANIAQTSTYLGASLGNDERDMHAFESRVGRLASDSESEGRQKSTVDRLPSRFTQNSHTRTEEGRKRTKSDRASRKILNKNANERRPDTTIH